MKVAPSAPLASTQGQVADVVTLLEHLTVEITDRSAGSPGNRAAAAHVEEVLLARGWAVERQEFEAMDWADGEARLRAEDGTGFTVAAHPYAPGCDVTARLVTASTIDELRSVDAAGALLLLHGEIAQTPLIPTNFPFYRDERHGAILETLVRSRAAAMLCATDAAPMIEDGDFDLPSASLTTAEGARLLSFTGRPLALKMRCHRIPSHAANLIGRLREDAERRIVVTAHLDAKKGVPGALDNATGLATLLLLADLLADHRGPVAIELVALNGEDHYAVPGQRAFLSANPDLVDRVALAVNIDGVGHIEGDTAYSLFGLPPDLRALADAELIKRPGACAGRPWPQGDHSMFVQAGCPAVAVTSAWLLDNMETQQLTHSQADRMELVDSAKVVASARALACFIAAASDGLL